MILLRQTRKIFARRLVFPIPLIRQGKSEQGIGPVGMLGVERPIRNLPVRCQGRLAFTLFFLTLRHEKQGCLPQKRRRVDTRAPETGLGRRKLLFFHQVLALPEEKLRFPFVSRPASLKLIDGAQHLVHFPLIAQRDDEPKRGLRGQLVIGIPRQKNAKLLFRQIVEFAYIEPLSELVMPLRSV